MKFLSPSGLAIGSTLLIAIFSNLQVVSLAVTKSIAVGTIRNPSALKIQGTFCDLHLVSDRQKRDVFLSAYQSQFASKALMNIDGRDIFLTSVREVKNERGAIATYRAGNLSVKVNYIRTSPEHEGASYDATISIGRGKQTTTFQATGACGI